MQHFMIPCDFGGRKAPFPIYVGEPKDDSHPLHHQSTWLSTERGGSIPQEVMDSFQKLHNIAKENGVSFEELCVYAMGEAMGDQAQPPQQDVTAAQLEDPSLGAGGMPPAPPPSAEDMGLEPPETPAETAPLTEQPAPQTDAAQHQAYGTHEERVESPEQDPNTPPHQNQN